MYAPCGLPTSTDYLYTNLQARIAAEAIDRENFVLNRAVYELAKENLDLKRKIEHLKAYKNKIEGADSIKIINEQSKETDEKDVFARSDSYKKTKYGQNTFYRNIYFEKDYPTKSKPVYGQRRNRVTTETCGNKRESILDRSQIVRTSIKEKEFGKIVNRSHKRFNYLEEQAVSPTKKKVTFMEILDEFKSNPESPRENESNGIFSNSKVTIKRTNEVYLPSEAMSKPNYSPIGKLNNIKKLNEDGIAEKKKCSKKQFIEIVCKKDNSRYLGESDIEEKVGKGRQVFGK